MVETVISGAETGGRVVRPWIGATGQSVDAEFASSLRLSRPFGVLVNKVYRNGPAGAAGLRVGDVIVSINGKPIPDANALKFRIATMAVGGAAKVGVLRSGRQSELSIKLIPAPEVPPKDLTLLTGKNPFAGAEVANLSPALAEELSLEGDLTGVIIVRIRRQSTAARIGLAPGDTLLRLNSLDIVSVAKLKSLLRQKYTAWRIEIKRAGQILQINLRG